MRNDIFSLGKVFEEMHLGWQYRSVIARCQKDARHRYENISSLKRDIRFHGYLPVIAGGLVSLVVAVCLLAATFFMRRENPIPIAPEPVAVIASDTCAADTLATMHIAPSASAAAPVAANEARSSEVVASVTADDFLQEARAFMMKRLDEFHPDSDMTRNDFIFARSAIEADILKKIAALGEKYGTEQSARIERSVREEFYEIFYQRYNGSK